MTLYFFGADFTALMGILGGGFYLHNITIPIVRHAKEPHKNVRNLFIGYVLVLLTYSTIGILGYIGFSGERFTSSESFVFTSNCLQMFPATDPAA